MRRIADLSEVAAALGTTVAAMGCAFCFPALGALGASLGLGFLSAYEGVLITRILPVLAVIVLALGAIGWWRHRVHWRGVLSLIGPVTVLAALYPLWPYGWSNAVFYAGLAVMVAVSLLDLIKPPVSVACPTS